MITDIEEGEKALRVDPEATEKLLARLGLGPRRTRQVQTGHSGEQSAPAAPSHRRRVGQRNPTRDAVKKEVETDG